MESLSPMHGLKLVPELESMHRLYGILPISQIQMKYKHCQSALIACTRYSLYKYNLIIALFSINRLSYQAFILRQYSSDTQAIFLAS